MHKTNYKDWFVFTRRERRAAIVLLCVIALVMILPYFVPAKKPNIHFDKELQAELDRYTTEHPSNNDQVKFVSARDTTAEDTVVKTLFYFDPNTLNEEGFSKLGLNQKTIHTLINYRSKGGYFKTPEDIRKIYGLSKGDAKSWGPYGTFESSTKKQKDPKKNRQPPLYKNQNMLL